MIESMRLRGWTAVVASVAIASCASSKKDSRELASVVSERGSEHSRADQEATLQAFAVVFPLAVDYVEAGMRDAPRKDLDTVLAALEVELQRQDPMRADNDSGGFGLLSLGIMGSASSGATEEASQAEKAVGKAGRKALVTAPSLSVAGLTLMVAMGTLTPARAAPTSSEQQLRAMVGDRAYVTSYADVIAGRFGQIMGMQPAQLTRFKRTFSQRWVEAAHENRSVDALAIAEEAGVLSPARVKAIRALREYRTSPATAQAKALTVRDYVAFARGIRQQSARRAADSARDKGAHSVWSAVAEKAGLALRKLEDIEALIQG